MNRATTIIGGSSAPATQVPGSTAPSIEVTGQANAQLVPTINAGPIVLTDAQLRTAEQVLGKLSFQKMRNDEIVTIGKDAEDKLKKTLDAFLAVLDPSTAEEVFKLFDKLQKGVQDAELPQIVTSLQTVQQPSGWARFTGMLRGKKLSDLVQEAFNKLRGVISGKTKTLCDVVTEVEKESELKMKRLVGELQKMEQLKIAYAQNIGEFAVAAVVAQNFLEQSRLIVTAEEERLKGSQDPHEKAGLEEMRQRLQLLDGRATNLVGSYTRLPADRMVILQIQQAGVQTFQEMVITSGSRMASIKINLIALNAGFAVKSVQLMADRQAALDKQLADVRGGLVKDIATTAATAPGDNRLAQAAQIQQIINQTKEIDQLVKAARQQNETKFAQAREQFDQARQELIALN